MDDSTTVPLDIALLASHLNTEEIPSHPVHRHENPSNVVNKDINSASNSQTTEPQKLEAEPPIGVSSLTQPSLGPKETPDREDVIPGLDEPSIEVLPLARSEPDDLIENNLQGGTGIAPSKDNDIGLSLRSLLAKHNLHVVASDSSDADGSSETREESESESESEEESETLSSSESSDNLPANYDGESGGKEEATKRRNKAKKRMDEMIGDTLVESGSESDTHGIPSSFATAHEITSPAVTMPSITEVPVMESIELIGEVLSIVDSVVVVKSFENGTQRVLDTDSLLVFEDRKVLGLIFETFGPLTSPLYSLRFPSSAHIPANTTISRKVFYCPRRSTFAYTSNLLLQKGNDASNFYDEEVGEEEIEFSDDEAEREWKRQKDMKIGRNKRRRGSKAGSSRGGSVVGEDVNSRNEDVILPYDDDFSAQDASAGLSYEDPYAEPSPISEGVPSTSKKSANHSLSSRRVAKGRPELPPKPYSVDRSRPRGRGGGRGYPSGNYQPRQSSDRRSRPNGRNDYYGNDVRGPESSIRPDLHSPHPIAAYNPAFARNPPMMPPLGPPFSVPFSMNPGAFNNMPIATNGLNQFQFPGSMGPLSGVPNFHNPNFAMGGLTGGPIGLGNPVPGAHINPSFAMRFGLMNATSAPGAPVTDQNLSPEGNDATTGSPQIEDRPV